MPTTRNVAIVAFAQTDHRRTSTDVNEVELIQPAIHAAFAQVGIDKSDIGFTVSGSSDYLAGQAFSFVMTLDAVGPFPPISESHVEMDGAWALYEAWVKIQSGAADTALVYSYGKSSPGDLPRVLSRQLDPYYYAPLWPDSVSVAALQARLAIEAGITSEKDMAEIVVRSREAAASNPHAHLRSSAPAEQLLGQPYLSSPLRRHDCPPISDGGAAIVLAADDRARELIDRPAWIRGIDHRIDSHNLGARDLTTAPSATLAAQKAGLNGGVQLAEVHAPFSHQEAILRRSLGLGDDVSVNPSGGALAANPMLAAGLIRLGEAAARISSGEVDRALAHATGGHCLQQNLVAVLEGEG